MSSKKKTLWTRNYTLLIMATVSGSVGGIAGGFALSFLVFDETGSTLAAALLLALEMIPMFVIPLVASPIMDRLPRKPFLVGGDAVNGLLYLLAGVYLLKFDFTYIGYLVFSLILTSLSTFDRLAYNSIYPKLIEEGFEDKGYTVSGMLYPVLNVIMAPVAAWLYERIGVSFILIMQGGLSLLAALIESFIKIKESTFIPDEGFSLGTWLSDIKEAAMYLKKEKGL
ncbi:MAG: MFS transporter, partial [Clostridia bacterium]|nr:MFS transporter [Clostridia bacterium]